MNWDNIGAVAPFEASETMSGLLSGVMPVSDAKDSVDRYASVSKLCPRQ
jgi:hypothetical protein